MIDAAKGAGAGRVIAVTTWFGSSRQDKKSAPPCEPERRPNVKIVSCATLLADSVSEVFGGPS